MIRKLLTITALLLVLVQLPLVVSANAPPDAEYGEYAYSTGYHVFMMLLAVICPIIVTCFSEWLVGFFFKLDSRHTLLIVLTNLVSQLLMWAVYFFCCYRFREFTDLVFTDYYPIALLALEIPVFVGEFFFYRSMMREMTTGKCMCYTVMANVVSLGLGLLLNIYPI